MSEPSRRSPVDAEPTDEKFAALFDAFADIVAQGNAQQIQDFLTVNEEARDRLLRLMPTMRAMSDAASEVELRNDSIAAYGDSSQFPAEATHADGFAALATRKTLGDFRVVREIARGGMGIVYEAEQVSMNRRVALKILPLAAVMDPRQVRRFKNEVQAAAILQHQNIVPVYSVGCERGIHYYAMQYVDGHTLAEIIAGLRDLAGLRTAEADGLDGPARTSPEIGATLSRMMGEAPAATDQGGGTVRAAHRGTSLGTHSTDPAVVVRSISATCASETRSRCRAAARLMVQAAEALDHAHERGVLHRDIKPGNLMIDSAGNLWITDFGLARLEADPGMTMTGQVIGTLRYMSPEQALARRAVVDHRTDIYSLGATLYELCALQPAYPAENRPELLKQITLDPPRPLRKCNSAIPRELEIITSKAMEKDPIDRYETAREMADDLRRYLDHRPILARPPSLRERVWKWSMRHRRTVCAVASAAIVFILASLAGLSFHSRQLSKANQALEALNTELIQSHRDVRELLYLADMRLAFQEWDGRRLDEVQRLLARYVPRQGEDDIRGREWHLLAALAKPLEPFVFQGHDCPVREIALVPGKEEFVSVGDRGTVRHWSISQKRLLRTIQTDAEQLHAVAVSPDGKWLATGNPTLDLWDFSSGKKVRELATNDATLESIAFAPDGETIAAAWRYDVVRLVKRNGEVMGSLPATGLRNETLAFSQDGHTLYVPFQTEQGHVIRRWEVDSPTRWSDIGKGPHRWSRITVSDDDAVTAVLTNGGLIRIVQNATGQVVAELGTSAEVVRTLRFSPDSDRLVWGSDDGMFHVAALRRGWQTGPTSALRHVVPQAFSAHSRKITDVKCLTAERFLTCSEDGSIRLWNLFESEVALRMALPNTAVNSIAFAPDSTQLAIAGDDGCIYLASAVDGRITDASKIGDPSLLEAAFYPDGSRVVVGNDRGGIATWDCIRRRVVAEWKTSQPARILAIAIAQKGDFLASAAADQLLRIHEGTSLSVVTTIAAPSNIKALDFSPDGQLLACGGDFSELFLYDTGTWQPMHCIPTRSESSCIAFANQQQRFASGHSNGFIQIVDARDGRVLRRRSSGSRVRSLAWSSDDRLLLSTHDDGTQRVWHVPTGTELGILYRGGMMFSTTRLSPDGRLLATVFCQDNTSQGMLWRVDDSVRQDSNL